MWEPSKFTLFELQLPTSFFSIYFILFGNNVAIHFLWELTRKLLLKLQFNGGFLKSQIASLTSASRPVVCTN